MRYPISSLFGFVIIIVLSASCVNAQWQVSQLSVPFNINFDSTVYGVNTGTFSGVGYTSAPMPGSLDSDAWAIFGLSSGNLHFGDTGLTGDYARGISSGGVGTGGVYAMDHGIGGVGNRALGIQAGGSDFTPGYHLLRVINSSADTVGSIDLSYHVLEYNDQGRSSIVKFYWGMNDLALNYLVSMDFISGESASASPSWQASFKSAQIQLSLLPGDTVYFKWYSDDYGGSGSRDEIAIDDIEVSFLPVGNQPPQFNTVSSLPEKPQAGQAFDIYASITDPDGLDSVFVLWGLDSLNLNASSSMQMVGQDSFMTNQSLPGQLDSTSIYFRIIAIDGHMIPLSDTSRLQAVLICDPLPKSQSGDLIITELMINPTWVSDVKGEYVELYNASNNTYNLEGFSLMDSGSDSARINSRLIILPRQFMVLARDSSMASNGGFNSDYQYNGFTLNNLNDEVYLISPDLDTIDIVEYTGGSVWLSSGAAMTYTGAVHQDNNNLMLWQPATRREPGFSSLLGDLGSPGFEGVAQVIDHLVFVDGTWSNVPDSTTSQRKAVVRSGELVIFGTNAEIESFVVEPTAALDIGSYQLTVHDTLSLLADSTGYSQLIGKVDGRVHWQSYLQSNSPARWFNLAIPLKTNLDSVEISNNGRINTLAEVAGDTGSVNIWSYDADQINSNTGEGTWVPISSKQQATNGLGFSLYSGLPYFGSLPQTVSAVGELLNQNIQIPLANITGPAQYNFIGNPFTSLIDWDEIIADNPILNKTYFIYNDGPDSSWVAYNSIAGAVSGGASNLIAPGQSFFINANGENYIDLETDCRSIVGKSNLFSKISPPGVAIRITTDEGRSDLTYLGFSPLAHDSLDPGLDALKRINHARKTPSIYSVGHGRKYMYNFISDSFSQKTLPLELIMAVNSQITLNFDLINIDPSWIVTLEDLSANSLHDIRNGPYTLNYISDNGVRRFHLNINTAGINTVEVQQDQTIIKIGDQLLYQGSLPQNAEELIISDIQGRIIFQNTIQSVISEIHLNEIDVSGGVYMLWINGKTGKRLVTRKIWLK